MTTAPSPQMLEQTSLFEMMANQFDQLLIVDSVKLTDMIWRINTPTHIVSLDFSLFAGDNLHFSDSVAVNYNKQSFTLSLPDLAKLLWLNHVKAKSPRPSLYQNSFEFIALVIAYVSSQGHRMIDGSNLSDFYEVCLTQNVTPEGFIKRLSAPAYGYRFEPITLLSIKKILRRFSIEGIVGQMTQKTCNEAFNNACLSMLNMTLNEYKAGGSFNFLGLDIGKHYLDHCYNLFEAHAPFITALRQTFNWWQQKGCLLPELKIKSRNNVTTVMACVMSGYAPNKKMGERCKGLSLDKCILAESLIHRIFRDYYMQALRKVAAFDISTINRAVNVLKLPERYDTEEFVRSLFFVELFGEHGKSKKAIIKEYQAVMSRENTPCPLSCDEIQTLVEVTLDEVAPSLPRAAKDMRQFFQTSVEDLPLSLDEHSQGGMAYFKKVCALIEDSGLTCFVGLTGWRASEYGFPLASIDITPNPDPLDNFYTPFRFHVRWKVPKTSGSTLLEREITLSSYILASQLATMNNADDNKPALYMIVTKGQTESSEKPVKLAIPAAWASFIQHYCLFVDIERWEALQSRDKLSSEDVAELERLTTLYNFDSTNTKALIQMKHELRQACPRTSLCLEKNPTKSFGSQLALYAEGKAPPNINELFDNNLSSNTKEELKNGDVILDMAAVRFVRGEFLADAAYPTPHALRHIWAEAVLRRYRGDVGRFIRANFKHIDERFFMAYLRNKEMKAIHQVASRQVINSVVRQQISNLQDDDRAYAGGFDRFLSKAVSITKVYTHEERMQLADKITQDRITAIKSNPWGTCLLRQGTDELAKCSVDGEPQRQNASPSLCLGCLNANVSGGNFNGIVVYTKQDVLACRNPNLPWFIKEPHVRTVNLALKRVKELRGDKANPKYDKFIQHLEASLELAEQNKGNAA